jgi:hypothetical protein
MIDTVDRDLSGRFAHLGDRTDDSSWREVLVRAGDLEPRPLPRTWLAIAAALILAVVVTAPAVGLPAKIVRLFRKAQPAPQTVQKSFVDFDEVVSANLAAPPREVLETRIAPGARATLWVAPTRSGGFCSLIKLRLTDGSTEGAGGECGPRLRRLSVDVTLHGPFASGGAVVGGPVLVHGFEGEPKADSLRLAFQDGSTASIPLVWVSEPVAMGFFVYAVPRDHWRAGHLPTTLTVRADDGSELARVDIHGIPTP